MKHTYILSAIFISIFNFTNAQIVSTLAGHIGYGSANGMGTAASFNAPNEITTDGMGNLYIADQGNNEIRKVVISTGVVTTFAGDTMPGFINGAGTSARFNQPFGLACDGVNLYVTDSNNAIRQIVISTGIVTTLAGSATSGSKDGIGTSASFNRPSGLAIDGSGNLYISDQSNNEIRKVVVSTGVVTTLAGSTTPSAKDGTGTAAGFYFPSGLALDNKGNLYVADVFNNKIRQIVISTGLVTTMAGSGIKGFANGTGTTTRFYYPSGLATDGNGNLYVADEGNNIIRKIIITSATVTTFAGSVIPGNVNGVDTAARFSWPGNLTIDQNGNMYLDDEYNEIRMITAPLGIYEILEKNAINIYPNPANQILYLKSLQPISAASLKIMDITGRELLNQSINTQQSLLSIDVSSLSAGIYFLNIENSKGILVTKKFLKQ